jgi:hypothetical protein
MFTPRRAALIAAGLTVVCVAFTASPAAAFSQQGRTRYIVDGDTTKVDIYGDSKADWISIRNAGIQAMELGQCHAAPAKTAMSALVANRVVTMSSSTSTASNVGRPLRFIDYTTSTGVRVDVPEASARAGPRPVVPAGSRAGPLLHLPPGAVQGCRRRRNLWSKTYCGIGPQQDANLKVVINYDADGTDTQNLNDEYVRIANMGSTNVTLSGWWLRSANPDPSASRAVRSSRPAATSPCTSVGYEQRRHGPLLLGLHLAPVSQPRRRRCGRRRLPVRPAG